MIYVQSLEELREYLDISQINIPSAVVRLVVTLSALSTEMFTRACE
jgi:hypothetical protein